MRSGMIGPMMFEINEMTKKVNKMTETSCLFFITLPLANLGGLPKVVVLGGEFYIGTDNLIQFIGFCIFQRFI